MDHGLVAALLRQFPESLVIVDASLAIVEYLGHAARSFGWTRDEVLGARVTDVSVWRFPDGDAEPFLLRLRGGGTARTRLQVQRKDCCWCDLDVVALPLEDATGALLGWLGIAREPSSRTTASEALRAEHTSLAHVVHGANDATWDWDLRSGEVLVNARWAEMLGRSHGPMTSSIDTWAALLHPDDVEHVRREVWAHQHEETATYQAEYRLRHAEGHWVWVLDRGKVVERAADGAALRMSGAFTDITARKAAEERLQVALAENETLVRDLRDALQRVHTLAGLVPICMHCKKVRDDAGYWARIEEYLSSHTGAAVTHGICPQCLEEHYPGYAP